MKRGWMPNLFAIIDSNSILNNFFFKSNGGWMKYTFSHTLRLEYLYFFFFKVNFFKLKGRGRGWRRGFLFQYVIDGKTPTTNRWRKYCSVINWETQRNLAPKWVGLRPPLMPLGLRLPRCIAAGCSPVLITNQKVQSKLSKPTYVKYSTYVRELNTSSVKQ